MPPRNRSGLTPYLADGRVDLPQSLRGRFPPPHDPQQFGVQVDAAQRVRRVQLHESDQPLGDGPFLMNHSHTGPYKAGVTYYLVFSSPATGYTTAAG